MADVDIYTVRYCPYCQDAKDLLSRKGVSFHEIDVTGKRDVRKQMIQRAHGREAQFFRAGFSRFENRRQNSRVMAIRQGEQYGRLPVGTGALDFRIGGWEPHFDCLHSLGMGRLGFFGLLAVVQPDRKGDRGLAG